MSTIKATLEASADGTLHLPVPPELRQGKVNIVATIELVAPDTEAMDSSSLKGFGCLKGKLWLSSDFDEPLEDFKEYME